MKNSVFILIALLVTINLSAQQFSGYRFCIDPGHGGHDPANDRKVELPYGIIFWESEGNLETAFHLDTILKSLGATTKLTRTANDDADDISLSARSTIANDFGADFFQSIHTNAYDQSTNYSLVLYKEVNGTPAFTAAKNMADKMAPVLQSLLRTTDAYSRGDYSFLGFNLGVLRDAQMPSVLSEGAFHDVPEEGLLLKSTWFSQNYAWAIAKTYLSFYNKTGFSKGRVGGVITDSFTHEKVNGVLVVTNPGDIACLVDQNYNGFYALDLDPGDYTLRLTKDGYITKDVNVTIAANEYTELDIEITYYNNGIPRADFFVSGLPAGAGQTLDFDASNSIDPDGNITAYDWDFSDGATATGVTTSHAFSADGVYPVQLVVTDNENKKDTIIKEVTIRTNPPDIPVISSITRTNDNYIRIAWEASNDQTAAYRIYMSQSDDLNDFVLLADTSELLAGTLEYINDTLELNSAGYNFKITAVNSAGESDFSDTYSVIRNANARTILIVDGYDRLGSWGKPTHTFAHTYMSALRDADTFNISCASNEAVSGGKVNLSDYDIVLWFLGDESTADETFSTLEQQKVRTYLEAGGYLLVTGAEIGWDLSAKGTSTDKSFYNNYLKASYKADGSSGNNPATGISGTIFSANSLNYGQIYPEDYPDEITAINGSENILRYKNGQTAAIAYKGKFGSSNNIGAVINVAFPLESVDNHASLVDFMQKAIQYFDGWATGLDDLQSKTSNFEIYPVPANNYLNVRFTDKQEAVFSIEIQDISGKIIEKITDLPFFSTETKIDVSNLNSGIYILKLYSEKFAFSKKFIKE